MLLRCRNQRCWGGWCLTHGGSRSRCRRPRRRRVFRDVDAALEVSAVLDHDAGGLDISHQLGFFLDVDLVGGFDITLNGAVNDDLASLESRLDPSVRSYGQAMLMTLDGSFHL